MTGPWSRGRHLWSVVASAVVALLLTSCSHAAHSVRPATYLPPLPDLTLTPPGWAPVSLGAIQISVPSQWFVEDPEYICGGGVTGMVFINKTPSSPPAGMGCVLPMNVVEMTTSPPSAAPRLHAALINGRAVKQGVIGSGSTSTEVVEAGTTVEARGPLAGQVIATITPSPLSVVLLGSVNTVPAGWRGVTFGGISFSVPGSWSVEQTKDWGGCPGNIGPNFLTLSTAQVVFAPGCPAPPENAGFLARSQGMVVGAGPKVGSTPPGSTCLHHVRNGLDICIDPPPPPTGGFEPGHNLGLLTAQVKVPGQTTLDQIEIGLSGTGVEALQIFDSMRPNA